MHARSTLSTLAPALLLLAGCAADPDSSEADMPPPVPLAAVGPIPIDASTGHILLRVRVNGAGPYWFMLDTGNPSTAIFESVAEDLALPTAPLGQMVGAGSGSVPVRFTPDLSIAIDERRGTAFVEPRAVVIPQAQALRAFGDKQIAGFLGASFIERFAVTIDYDAATLTLTNTHDYQPPVDATILDMPQTEGFPYFEGSVVPIAGGKPVQPVTGRFLLDLGAPYGVAIKHRQAAERDLIGASEARAFAEAIGIDGEPFRILALPAETVLLGDQHLAIDTVYFPDRPGGGPPIENLVGDVGSAAFKGWNLTLDYARDRLVLSTPPREPASP